MKKLILLITLIFCFASYGQTTVHNAEVKIKTIPQITVGLDSLVFWGSDQRLKHVEWTDLLTKLEQDLNVSGGGLNDHFSITANYTTLSADNHRKGIITNGNITLDDDPGIGAEYELTLLNSKGTDVTISLGPSQQTKQYGFTDPPNLTNGSYAYIELIADNVWSIIVQEDSGGGGTIGGSITDGQIAVGAVTNDEIEGTSALTFDDQLVKVNTAGNNGGFDLEGIGRMYINGGDLYLAALSTSTDVNVSAGATSGVLSLSGSSVQLGSDLDTNGKHIVHGFATSSIGSGEYGVNDANKGYLFWSNEKATFRSHDNGVGADYGDFWIEYDNFAGLRLGFIDDQTDTAEIVYKNDGFVVNDITDWNFEDGIVSGRWAYKTDTNSTTTDVTIASTDNGEIIYYTGATDITVTINDVTSGLTVGEQVTLVQAGSGQITLATSNYGTVLVQDEAATVKTRAKGCAIQAVNYEVDSIHIFGGLE